MLPHEGTHAPPRLAIEATEAKSDIRVKRWPSTRSNVATGMARQRLVSSTELAAELGLSRRSITRYATAGHITPELVTPGGKYRWNVASVKHQLDELQTSRRSRVNPAADGN